jgi:hypothetical protein
VPDDLAIMNGPDISAVLDGQSLPVQQRGQEPSMAMQEAMEVCFIPRAMLFYLPYHIIHMQYVAQWCQCINGTALEEENHTAFIFCWLPTH